MGSHRSSQALVIIEHALHYSLYLSDETGTFYTLSLEDLVRGSDGATDLEIVRESTYIYILLVTLYIIICVELQ